MIDRRQSGSIGKRWIVLFGMVIFGIIAAGYEYYHFEERIIWERKYRELRAIGQLKAGQISEWYRERLSAVYGHSKDPLLRQAFGNWVKDKGNLALKNNIIERTDLIKDDERGESLIITDSSGTVELLPGKKATDLDSVVGETIKNAVAALNVKSSDFYRCSICGKIHIDIASPVLDRNRIPIAAIVLRINPDNYLYPLIQSWPIPSETAETLLIRKENNGVIFLNELRHLKGTVLSLSIPLTLTDVPSVQAALGRKGIFEGKDYRDVDVLSDLIPVPGSPWFMVAKIDKAEILSEVKYQAVLISVVICLFIILSSIVFVFIYQSRQKNLYQKFYQSEERFRRIYESAVVGISLTAVNGTVTDVNESFCRMLGYTREELAAKGFGEVTYPEDLAKSKESVESLFSGDRDYSRMEKRYITKDGRILWADVSTTLLHDLTGKPLHFITHVIDITEQKRASETIRELNAELERRVRERTAQLETADKEMESFAYSVSHDLRAPLRAMAGFSAVLQTAFHDRLDEQGRHYLDRIQEASGRMGRMIDDLLILSRVTRREITRQPVDMSALAREIVTELKARDPERQAEIVIADDMAVDCDKNLIRQALENLLDNAWKYTGPRPQARIEVGVMQESVERIYFVRDNGVGFDMTYADKLFVPFQRLHGLHEFPGTGVGLATVQRIINRHGGRLWAQGAVNEGAIFSFTIGGV